MIPHSSTSLVLAMSPQYWARPAGFSLLCSTSLVLDSMFPETAGFFIASLVLYHSHVMAVVRFALSPAPLIRAV